MLKTLRQAAGLTQAGLAKASGINLRQIQKIEAGEIRVPNITLATAAKLAAALGLTTDELLARCSE